MSDLNKFNVIEIPANGVKPEKARVLDGTLKYELRYDLLSRYMVIPESYIHSEHNHESYREPHTYKQNIVSFSREERENPNRLFKDQSALDHTYTRPTILVNALGMASDRKVVPLNVLVYMICRAARGDISVEGNMLDSVVDVIARDLNSVIAITARILNSIDMTRPENHVVSYQSFTSSGSKLPDYIVPLKETILNLKHRLLSVVNASDVMALSLSCMHDKTVIMNLPFTMKTSIRAYEWQSEFVIDLCTHLRSYQELVSRNNVGNMMPAAADLVKYCGRLGKTYTMTSEETAVFDMMGPYFAQFRSIISRIQVVYPGGREIRNRIHNNSIATIETDPDISESERSTQLAKLRDEYVDHPEITKYPAIYRNSISAAQLIHFAKSVIKANSRVKSPGKLFDNLAEVMNKIELSDTKMLIFGYLNQIDKYCTDKIAHPSLYERTLPRKLYYVNSVAGSGKTSLVTMLVRSIGNNSSIIFCCEGELDVSWAHAVTICKPIELRDIVNNCKVMTPEKPVVVFFDEFCMDMKTSEASLDALEIDGIDVMILSGATIPPVDRLALPVTYSVESRAASIFNTYLGLYDIRGRTANPLALNQHYDMFMPSESPMLRRLINREVCERALTTVGDINAMASEAHAILSADPTHNKLFIHRTMPRSFDWLKQIVDRAFSTKANVIVFCNDDERDVILPILDTLYTRMKAGDNIQSMGLGDYTAIAENFENEIYQSAENTVEIISRLEEFDIKKLGQKEFKKADKLALSRASSRSNKLTGDNTMRKYLKSQDPFKFLRNVREFRNDNHDPAINLYVGSAKTSYGLDWKNVEYVFLTPAFGIIQDTDTTLQALARAGRTGSSSYAHAVIGDALKYRYQLISLNSQDSIIMLANHMSQLNENSRFNTDFFEFIDQQPNLNNVTKSIHKKLAIALITDQLYATPEGKTMYGTGSMDEFIRNNIPRREAQDMLTAEDRIRIRKVLESKRTIYRTVVNRPRYKYDHAATTFGLTRYKTTGTNSMDFEDNAPVPIYDPGTVETVQNTNCTRENYVRLIEKLREDRAGSVKLLDASGSKTMGLRNKIIEIDERIKALEDGNKLPITVDDVFEHYLDMRETMQSYALVKLSARKYIGLDFKISTGSSVTKINPALPYVPLTSVLRL